MDAEQNKIAPTIAVGMKTLRGQQCACETGAPKIVESRVAGG
jgi:hypothetical protein